MRRLVVLAAAALALAGAGCGDSEGVKTTAETEGLYLNVNGLKYQIQMSRYMNPNDVEDSEYLVGLPESPSLFGTPLADLTLPVALFVALGGVSAVVASAKYTAALSFIRCNAASNSALVTPGVG